MTNRKIKELFKIISPEPGYILDLSRAELEDIVEDTTPYELPSQGSNGNRLKVFLAKYSEEEMDRLTTALLKKAGWFTDD